MMRRIALLVALVAAFVTAPALAQPKFPERGTAPVVDAANIIDPATEAALTEKLDQFEQANQRQFVVATVPDLEGYDIADYGYQLGRAWGLGDAENDDGVLLLVAPNERKVRIEVGYGLEPVLTDALSTVIIQRDILPAFKDGDMPRGIVAGTDAIIHQLQLPPEEAQAIAAQAQAQPEREGFPIGFVIWGLFIVFFFVLPVIARAAGGRKYRGRGRRGDSVAGAVGEVLLWTAINAAMNSGKGGGGSSGWGGFSGGGGGGFSGGGGSFGGGGASGSW